MRKIIFVHHTAPLGFSRVLPPIKSFLGGCPSVGNIFFLLIMWLPLPPINYFQEDAHSWEILPQVFSLLDTSLQPLPYLFPFMYLPIYSQYI